ncbi:nucleoside recognition GATE domain-containing membrane protein YjiH [Dethiosulfatibacter aminovorans DSM 17477]|uniref:Nucleoside recognition GATE domain-containing membrane protein YjiH n=1 Tax=Dethiosulfatibacter aminovorans DSM 17477 TaxID=1121476 RepID=A0A1M6CEE7_9FIRM|nr:nucleoside recognition domain-containing protein [Dethiosulfatibacter aminovorans]SHI59356.1 nucleoside recognition GATE domain-containing membrane protein YjiH [Dethiosulfatibacter aminovorans DSM 17477]
MEKKNAQKNLTKSISLTVLGLIIFTMRFPGSQDTILLKIIHTIQGWLSPHYSTIVLIFMLGVCALTLDVKLFRPSSIGRSQFIRKNFNVSNFQVLFRLTALAFTIVFIFLDSPAFGFLNIASGEIIIMSGSMLVFITVANLFLPLLSDFGLAEFLGVLLDRFIKPVFKVPGNSIINIFTAFFIGSTMGMYLTGAQYEKKLFSRREAMRIISALVVPSIPTAMIYWSLVGDMSYFFKFYTLTFLTFYTLGLIMVRIPPLSRLDDAKTEKRSESSGEGKLKRALDNAAEKAGATNYSLKENLISILGIFLSFIPFLISLGTIANIIIENTGIFEIATMPYGWYLSLFGFENPFLLGQTLILNCIDLVMPAIILKDLASVNTQIIMAVITLNQLIYIASSLIILSFDKLSDGKTLVLLFLERVILAVPLTVFWAMVLL